MWIASTDHDLSVFRIGPDSCSAPLSGPRVPVIIERAERATMRMATSVAARQRVPLPPDRRRGPTAIAAHTSSHG
ncbi:hypothetical protein L210DRAFT_2785099 [Boletus edulis BED1]|uniref:Uncharacterized protein n=1 Tax=Boletus edulis BED1 TaxID=1328754 RepID=A0AAD4C3E4_BOLED|nr:hypothetical protein L210DRAFT_2785099 [Boletus edulis BED1]